MDSQSSYVIMSKLIRSLLNVWFSASTGGLLGLFMGFSVVSLIEIIYFLSLRPYCAHRRYTRHEKIMESTKLHVPWYLNGVYDPKKPGASVIIPVRPFSVTTNKIHSERRSSNSPLNDSVASSRVSKLVKWKNMIQYEFNRRTNKKIELSEPAIVGVAEVVRVERRRYPYTE